MVTPDTSPTPIARFQKQKGLLEKLSTISKAGFAQVSEQMSLLSIGFASAPTHSFSAQERLSPQNNRLGIKQLQDDYDRIGQETKAILQEMASLVEQQSALQAELHQMTVWALEIEQDSLLPTMANQIKLQIGCELERQTLGTIVDSLMLQVRTLIREIILSTQESDRLLQSASRRLAADWQSSEHYFATLKSRSGTLMQQMTDRVIAMSLRCESLEAQSTQANSILFGMMQDMQIDDITAQRMEHLIATMGQIEQRQVGTKLKNADKRWTVIATRIAMEQLEDICKDLVAAVLSLHQHLAHIASVAVERKEVMITARNEAMAFEKNIADLSYQLGALLRLGIFDDNFSIDILRNFSKTENTLFQTRRAFEMLVLTAHRMEKLLSTLECKNNRRVATLSGIIGQLVTRIQNEGAQQSHRMLGLTNRLQEIGMNYSEQATPQIMRVITLLRRIPLRVQQMEVDHGDVLSLFSDIIAETQAIIVQIELQLADMEFHEPIKKGAEHVQHRMKEVLPELVGDVVLNAMEGKDVSSLAEEFADLASLYTMARERKAHGAVLGDAAPVDDGDGFEMF